MVGVTPGTSPTSVITADRVAGEQDEVRVLSDLNNITVEIWM